MNKKGIISKKGLSTVIVTLIIILISLVAIGTFWVVVQNLIKGSSENIGLDKLTLSAEIKGVNVDNSSNNVTMSVKRNVGEGDLTGMKFVFYNTSNTEVITEYIELNQLEERRFVFHLSMNVSNLLAISIVPVFSSATGEENVGNIADSFNVRTGKRIDIPPKGNQTCTPFAGNLCAGRVCGTAINGTCGNINCGTGCTGGQTCNSSGQCVSGACVPTTCAALGHNCGTWSNGTCGTNLYCGTCTTGTCNSSGQCESSTSLTYHIRTDGSDVNCNGLYNIADPGNGTIPRNCAYQTIQKGVNLAQPGNIVLVHAGDYSSSNILSVRSGTSGNLIIIQAASGENVTIGRVTISTGHDYIRLNGFRMTNFPFYPIWLIDIDGGNCEITNNYIYSNKDADYGESLGIRFQTNSHNNIVRGNIFDGQSTEGVVGKSIWVSMGILGTDHVIFNNTFKNMIDPERIFELAQGSGHIFSSNEVYNLYQLNVTLSHIDIFQSFAGTPNNIIIENNYFHDVVGQIGNIWDDGSYNWEWRNNIFANFNSVLYLHQRDQRFYNNIFYNVGNDSGSHVITSYPEATNLTIKNNIFFGCGYSPYTGWYSLVSGVADYNFVSERNYAAKSNQFSETHGINGGNPQFVAPYTNCVANVCNFHINANSFLRNNGTIIPTFLVDKDGISRPQGSAWDIGPYEYH